MMASPVGTDFSAPVRSGYTADSAKHRRQWKALEDYLRSPFITTARIKDAAITNAKIQDATISSAKIESLAVDKITGGELGADVTLGAGGILRTDVSPNPRVEIDSDGIRAYDGTGQTVDIPVTGSPWFKGTVVATGGVDAPGTIQMKATDNILAVGAALQLEGSGVANPNAAPTLTWGYDQLELEDEFPFGGSVKSYALMTGGFYDSVSGDYYLIYDKNTHGEVVMFDATTGLVTDTYVPGFWGNYRAHSVAKTASNWWVLVDAFALGEWKLHKHTGAAAIDSSTLSTQHSLSVSHSYSSVGIAYDPQNNRLVGAWQDADDDLVLRWYNPADATVTDSATISLAGITCYDIHVRDAGATVYLYVIQDTGWVRAYDITTPGSPSAAASEDFYVEKGRSIMQGRTTTLAGAYRDTPQVRLFSDWQETTVDYLHCRYT